MPKQVKDLKVVSDTATLTLNEKTSKWEVSLKLKKGSHILTRSKSSELAVKNFNSKAYKERLDNWKVSVLEVHDDKGKFVKTLQRGVKQPRQAPVTKGSKPSERKAPVRKPFPVFEVNIYGMQNLAGSTMKGKVLSRTSGNFNVETIGKHGKLIRAFNANTGILKGHNPFHGWQLNISEVNKLQAKAKAAA